VPVATSIRIDTTRHDPPPKATAHQLSDGTIVLTIDTPNAAIHLYHHDLDTLTELLSEALEAVAALAAVDD